MLTYLLDEMDITVEDPFILHDTKRYDLWETVSNALDCMNRWRPNLQTKNESLVYNTYLDVGGEEHIRWVLFCD